MFASQAGETAQLAGEAEPALMEDQQLQILPLGLPQQHAHRLVSVIERGQRQFVADDGLQGRDAVDGIGQLLHPALGQANHIDARATGRRGGQVHIIHRQLQHGFADIILDGPGERPRHLGVRHCRLVDLDLLIKAGGEGHPHRRLGQPMTAEQLVHGHSPLLWAVDGARREDGGIAHRCQHDPVIGQQEPDLAAWRRPSEQLFHVSPPINSD